MPSYAYAVRSSPLDCVDCDRIRGFGADERNSVLRPTAPDFASARNWLLSRRVLASVSSAIFLAAAIVGVITDGFGLIDGPFAFWRDTEFGPLIFCPEADFDFESNECTTSWNVFPGDTQKVWVSWKPSDEFRGSHFTRFWYRDDVEVLFKADNQAYAYYEPSGETMIPGVYRLELYVGGELVQRGGFRVLEQ